ncbi:MAG: serine/threonine protein kinase [Planctomycetes bacterium]|nr:serine/threonine protein kinase [Planctomycetota bacterium]
MANDTKREARRVFMEVADLSEAERPAALRRACGGDAALREEVEALLRAEERAGGVMSAPTGDLPVVPADAMATLDAAGTFAGGVREGPGTRIGPYRLLQLIGEGGFGSVFMAEQETPVVRKVALKIIKLGMDTRQVVARFEQERQALAMMDHPHIARVLDAGATETGRPFFVMELVKGQPITTYCDHGKLSIEDRLGLFAQVCTAVQHAHSKGIIHRDIKPSNILVSTQDGRPHAKVIDFGIAKATASKLTEKTLFTEHQAFIGTPEYMSPEQAEGNLDIDTRTDVYSLGVLLYELLTGTTPFSGKELRSAAHAEIQRIIREVEPPKPSTRLSANTGTIAGVAAQRHTEPRRLGMVIRGELDWIVMKALEKDRTRRYETANGLAMDIRRYLSGEAVVAAPPSTAYRFKKFVRRNRVMVAAGAAVGAALVLGMVGTIWQARVAAAQRDLARSEAARAVAAEAEAHRRADELLRVADFQGAMLAQVDPAAAGVKLTKDVRERFDAALTKAAAAEGERETQAELFASQWSRVNATDAALELIDSTVLKPAVAAIEKQFGDQPVVASTLRHVLAERYHDLGLDSAAVTLEKQALADRRRVLGEDHSDTLVSIGNVGVYLNAIGKPEEAEPYYREALEKSRRVRGQDQPETWSCLANLGNLLVERGRLSDAEPLLREALEQRRRQLGEEHPDTLESRRDWAILLREQGKLAEAGAEFREVLDKRRQTLGAEDRKTLTSLNDLATLMKSQGKVDEAVGYFREVVEARRRSLGEAHPSTLIAMQNLGAVLDANGQPQEAESLMREALAKQRQLLGPDHASTLTSLGNLSVYLIGQNKFTEAEPLCRETLERRRRVLGANHTGTLIANNVMGLVLIRQGKLAEGEPFWREALATAQRVLGPAHPETLIYLHNLAGLAIDQKKPAEAEQLYRQVVQTGTPAVGAEHPTVLSATRRLGGILIEQKRYVEAVELLSAAEPAARKAYIGSSERNLAPLLRNLGSARAQINQFAGAESNLLEAHAIFVKTLGETHKDTRGCVQALADFYSQWDKAEPGKGHDVKAAEWRAKAEQDKADPKGGGG